MEWKEAAVAGGIGIGNSYAEWKADAELEAVAIATGIGGSYVEWKGRYGSGKHCQVNRYRR